MFQLCLKNSSELWRNYFKSPSYVFFLTMVRSSFISIHSFKNMEYPIFSPPYTPKNNATTEHPHCHVFEIGITLLHNSNLPLKFWSYAFICFLPNQQVAHPNIRWRFTLFQIIRYSRKIQQTLCLWLFMLSMVASLQS